MSLYSFLNGYPQPLPFRIEVDGATRTDPNTFTEEEIRRAGYRGPFSVPEHDSSTQMVQWNGDEFEVVSLAPQEIEKRAEERVRRGADYKGFWKAFVNTNAYQELRLAAATSLKANMLVTELIAALGDAKAGDPNELIIGHAMQELLGEVALDADTMDGLYYAMKAYGMYDLFPIAGYVPPTEAV
jgi:hypothetical protein